MSDRTLARDGLERLIVDFLGTQGMCVIATCSGGRLYEGPVARSRASAVEFFPDGTTLYVLTEGGRKLENIEKNSQVSVAIHTQFTGSDSIKGIQITGAALIGGKDSAIFAEGEQAYIRRKKQAANLPDFMNVIKITPEKIEYLDMTLRAKGYDVRHVLECSCPGGSCFQV